MTHSSRQYTLALLYSYGALGVATLYSMLAIRWAAYFLPKEHLGLWALVVQVSQYLAILDFGMTGTLVLYLIDFRRTSEQSYADGMRTGATVLRYLGLTVLALSIPLGLYAGPWLEISPELCPLFRYLIWGQGAILCLSFFTKTLSASLSAANLQHLSVFVSAAPSLIGILCLWFAFKFNLGIYSFLVSGLVGAAVSIGLLFYLNHTCGISPKVAGVFDPTKFREMARFAKDGFIWLCGYQLVMTLPLLAMSRRFGLEDAADFSGGMKLALLSISLSTKLSDMAVVPLAHLLSAGERSRVNERFLQLARLSLVTGIACMLMIIAMNAAFLQWWTHGALGWTGWENVFLGAWVASVACFRCAGCMAYASKEVRRVRFTPVVEAVLFVGVYLAVRPYAGRASISLGMLAASVGSGIWISRRILAFAGISLRGVLSYLVRPLAVGALAIGVTMGISLLLAPRISPGLVAVTVHTGIGCLLALVFAGFAMPDEIRQLVLPQVRIFFRRILVR